MAIEWSEEYSVNVKELDEQHKNFIGIMNELYDSLNKMQEKDNLEKMLDRLVEYAQKHFATEEKYFDEFHYELADEHKQKHKELKEKLVEFKKQLNEGEEIYFKIMDFIEDWLVDHLGSQDKKYIECFNKNGLC